MLGGQARRAARPQAKSVSAPGYQGPLRRLTTMGGRPSGSLPPRSGSFSDTGDPRLHGRSLLHEAIPRTLGCCHHGGMCVTAEG